MLHWSDKREYNVKESKLNLVPVELSWINEDLPESINDVSVLEKKIENSAFHELLSDQSYNLLFEGDNSQILNALNQNGLSESVDLIYIDPPFMTNMNFFKQINLKTQNGNGTKEKIKQKQYNDRWALSEYLQFIYERLKLMRHVLKDTGSIYVHLDENCVHYVKVLMDEIFGSENFKRDITWNTASLNVAGFKGIIRDNWIYGSGHILFYTKSDSYTFNTQFNPRDQDFIDRKYTHEDENGRYRVTRRNNKIYLKDDQGEPMTNIWNDILSFNYAKIACNESVFYPTQKPEKLLRRIIKASSNPGDIVLDCFAGSGTTLAVAQKLGRRWIGIDANPVSVQTILKRIQRISKQKKDRHYILFKKNLYDITCNSELFDFDIEEQETGLFSVILKGINNDAILKQKNQTKLSAKERKKVKLSKKERSSLKGEIDLEVIDETALVDSYAIEILPIDEANLKLDTSIFHLHTSETPKRKNQPVSKKIVIQTNEKYKNHQKIQFRIKLLDIFGNLYFKAKFFDRI